MANDLESFRKIYEDITSVNYKYNGDFIEGFVIEDSNNFMVKTKTFYYNKWKYLRNKMENSIKNNNYKINGNDELENKFMKYLKLKYENKEIDIKNINIITERNEFEKNMN